MVDLFRFVRTELSNGYDVVLRAKGHSMFPLVRSDRDALILSGLRGEVCKGMVVLAYADGIGDIVHRVVDIDRGTGTITLRGDGNARGVECVDRQGVYGELVGVVRSGGKIIRKGDFWWRLCEHLWPSSIWCRALLLRLCRWFSLK